MQVDIYMAGDNRMPDTADRWVGYLISAKGSDKEVTGAANYIATYHESFLMIIWVALCRFIRPADITMHLEDGWVASCLMRVEGQEDERSLLERWQANGWKKSRGKDLENKDLWQRLYNKLRVFEQSGGTFRFVALDPQDKTDSDRRAKIALAIERSKQNPD